MVCKKCGRQPTKVCLVHVHAWSKHQQVSLTSPGIVEICTHVFVPFLQYAPALTLSMFSESCCFKLYVPFSLHQHALARLALALCPRCVGTVGIVYRVCSSCKLQCNMSEIMTNQHPDIALQCSHTQTTRSLCYAD